MDEDQSTYGQSEEAYQIEVVMSTIAYVCDADAHTLTPDEDMFYLPVSLIEHWVKKLPL